MIVDAPAGSPANDERVGVPTTEAKVSSVPDHVRSAKADIQSDPVAAALAARPKRAFMLRRLLAAADVLAITSGLAVSLFVIGTPATPTQFFWSILTVPAWILLFKMYGLYDRDGKRVSHSTVEDVPWLFHALVVGGLGFWLFTKLAPVGKLTLAEGFSFFCATFLLIFSTRAAARALARASIPPERVLFVGGGRMARLLIHKIRQHPEYGLSPIGYVDSAETDASDLGGELTYLGQISELESICRNLGVDRIVVVSPAIEETELVDLVRVATGLDLSISILPHIVDVLGPSVEIDDVEGITVLGINPPALTPSSRWLKRGMDVIIASVVLVLVLPLMVAIAVAVKIASNGPILYSQERIGRKGRRFRIQKFRTMVTDAEDRAEGLREMSAHSAWLLLDYDPRVTSIGRLLRRASLDELPQLWNVLRGDMSLVGPRPMTPDVDELIYGWGRRRLDLTPGITGLWQVLGRTNIPFEEMVKLDYLYVTNWSLWQDVRLLIHTLPAVMRRRGAN